MIRIDLLRRCFWIQSTEFGNNELLKEENDCDERMESIAPEIVSVLSLGVFPSFYNEDFLLQLSRWQALYEIPEISHLKL